MVYNHKLSGLKPSRAWQHCHRLWHLLAATNHHRIFQYYTAEEPFKQYIFSHRLTVALNLIIQEIRAYPLPPNLLLIFPNISRTNRSFNTSKVIPYTPKYAIPTHMQFIKLDFKESVRPLENNIGK